MQTHKTNQRLIRLGAYLSKMAVLLFYGPSSSGNP